MIDASPAELEALGLRLPPEATAAEMGCVAAALVSPDAAQEVALTLEPGDFTNGDLRRLFLCARRLRQRDRTPTLASVEEDLLARGEWRSEYRRLIADCLGAYTPIVPLKEHLGAMKRASRLRTLLTLLDRERHRCYERDADPAEIEERVLRALIETRPEEDGEPVTLAAAAAEELQRIRSGKREAALYFGLPALDDATGGMERGEVSIVAGRPGAGKTIYALQQLLFAAAHWGPTAFVSLEMGEHSLARRLLAGRSGLTYRELRDAGRQGMHPGEPIPFEPWELEAIEAAWLALAELPHDIYIDRRSSRLTKLVANVRRYRAQYGVEGVVVDYGQLVRDDTRQSKSRAEEVALVARTLKNEIAVPLNVPVLVLVQPNREVERRRKQNEAGRLQMSDLGWSGEWEAVASLIVFLNADPVAQGEKPPPRRRLVAEVAKSRNGQAGTCVELILDGPAFRLLEADTRHAGHEPPPERERYRDYGENDD